MSRLNPKLSVGCLVANVVGGSYGPIFQREVERYLRCNGRVWTTNRLKAIWNAALHLRNGDPDKAIALYRENSIAYHSDGTPKGPLRRAVRQFVAAQRPSVLRRWAAILRFYTGMVVEVATPKQVSKIRRSITSEGPSVDADILEQFSFEIEALIRHKPGPRPGTTWANSFSWESRYAQSLKGTSRYYSPAPLPAELREKYYGSMFHSLLTTHALPRAVDGRVETLEPSAKEDLHALDSPDESIGKVFFVMEGGCKVRCVAMPNAWTQLAFRPLHSILVQFQRILPESCVRDQAAGVQEALCHLADGEKMFSLDLSSATDRLPRKLQQLLLQKLELSDYAEALEEVCTRHWDFPDGTKVSYSVGQPMGLYGSFPLLNITNCLIGRMACRHCGIVGSWEKHFRVLGDDIIFFDEKPAHRYRSIMERMGVEISPLKTFEGSVGQFAGFVILPTSTGVTAFRPYKHPPGNEITNVIQFLRSLGSPIRRVSKKWEAIFNLFSRTESYRLLDDSPDPFWVDETEEPLLESIDDRWVHSVTNLCGWLDPDLYGTNLDLVYKDRPGENAEPLFHEQRMTRILGHGPDYRLNSEKEQEEFRVDKTLWSDPLFRKEISGISEIPVREHERFFVRPDGSVGSTTVHRHTRKVHRHHHL